MTPDINLVKVLSFCMLAMGSWSVAQACLCTGQEIQPDEVHFVGEVRAPAGGCGGFDPYISHRRVEVTEAFQNTTEGEMLPAKMSRSNSCAVDVHIGDTVEVSSGLDDDGRITLQVCNTVVLNTP